jgi:hypothetical protein
MSLSAGVFTFAAIEPAFGSNGQPRRVTPLYESYC